MALVTRSQIKTADDRPTKDIDVPEWGGEVRIRTLSGHEIDRFAVQMDQVQKGGKQSADNIRAHLCALSIVDEDNQRLYPAPSDIVELGEKSSAVLGRIFEEVQKLNGMTPDVVEEKAEDFDKTPSGDSPSV